MLRDQRNKLLVGVKFDVLVVAQKVSKGRGGVLAVVDHIVDSINHSRITEPLCLEPINQYLEELWRQSRKGCFYLCRIPGQLFLGQLTPVNTQLIPAFSFLQRNA